MNSPITVFAVQPREDTLLAGKYLVKKGVNCQAFLTKSHVDPTVWGPDANEFKPERMLDELVHAPPMTGVFFSGADERGGKSVSGGGCCDMECGAERWLGGRLPPNRAGDMFREFGLL